jgi:hypothetical protein
MEELNECFRDQTFKAFKRLSPEVLKFPIKVQSRLLKGPEFIQIKPLSTLKINR